MELTWHGHACIELATDAGTDVLVDPFLADNPTTETAPEDLDPDVVALTHGHFDHVADAHRFEAPVLCQPELTAFLADHGHDEAIGFNVGGTYEAGAVAFTMVQAFHSSGTPGDDADFEGYGGTPAGYVIDDGETRLYVAGDTGLFGDMRDVIGDVHDPDAAAVPIGDHYTMGPHDAAIAVDWLGVDVAVPLHYDTFPPIEQDPDDFAEAVTAADVVVPAVGQTVDLGGPPF